jgi:hypothetical protein
MEIINVIVIKEGIVDSCETFVAKTKAEVNANVQLAELKFAERASEYGASEDDMESHIEDGYYAGGNFSICLVHSDIQQ